MTSTKKTYIIPLEGLLFSLLLICILLVGDPTPGNRKRQKYNIIKNIHITTLYLQQIKLHNKLM